MSLPRSLSTAEFDQAFGSLYRSIFSEQPLPASPFRRSEWQVILIPYGHSLGEHDFRALLLAAGVCGDREIIIKDAETVAPPEAAVVIAPSFAEFEATKFRDATNLAIVDTHLFGRSGRWGCVFAASFDDVGIVGGDREYISTLSAALGGVPALRSRFLRFAQTEWCADEQLRAALLRMAGW